MVVLATPELQLWLTVPSALVEAIDKSREAEVSVKLPPVPDESVAITLVAFTVSASATEPDLTVRLIAGEVREKVKSAL